MDENPQGNPNAHVRVEVLEDMVAAMRNTLAAVVAHTNANADEVYSAVFTLTMRTMESATRQYGASKSTEYRVRKHLTILCERLWTVAAGEPFVRDQKNKTKNLPN